MSAVATLLERIPIPSVHAEPFDEMAELIRHVGDGKFSGAIVVVPPGDGEPIAFMLSDPKPDLVQFWSTVMARVEIRAALEKQKAEAPQGPHWR